MLGFLVLLVIFAAFAAGFGWGYFAGLVRATPIVRKPDVPDTQPSHVKIIAKGLSDADPNR